MAWNCIHHPQPMKGHKFFVYEDRSGAIHKRAAIADWSGFTPTETDDGTLWVDPSRAVVFSVNGTAIIPLLRPNGDRAQTISDFDSGVFAVTKLGLRAEAEPALAKVISLFPQLA